MSPSVRPLRVAIVNDYDLVVAGVAAMLAPHHERVAVVELDSNLPVVSDVDVILYDTFGQVQGDGVDLEDLVRGSGARVVIFSWNTQPDLVERAIRKGAAGYLSKELSSEEIVGALETVHEGKIVVPQPSRSPAHEAKGDWPGRDVGLTAREAEVLALITQGLQQPGDRRALLPQHQLGEDLHPHGVPQDRRHPARPGGDLGDEARLRADPVAGHRDEHARVAGRLPGSNTHANGRPRQDSNLRPRD